MKNIYLLVTCLLLFAACKKNEDDPKVAPTAPVIEAYKFKDIKYSIEKTTDGAQESAVALTPLIFKNASDAAQAVRLNPTEGIKETSFFQSDDKQAFSLLNGDSVKVSAPSFISGNSISLGTKKWLYTDKQIDLPSTSNLKDSINMTPHTVLSVKMSVIVRKYTATYTATFVGQNSGKELSVKGTWTGSTPVGANITTQIDPLQ